MRRSFLLSVLILLLIFAAACSRSTAPAPTQVPVTPTPEATKRLMVTLDVTVTPTPLPSATPLPELSTPLVWLLRGDAPTDLPKVNAALNALLKERGLQASVELRPLESLGYEQAIDQAFSEGQAFDLISLSAVQYPLLAESGRLLPLNAFENPETGRAENLLEGEFNGLRTSAPPFAWNAVTVEGVIYGVPNQNAWARPCGIALRKDVVEALNLTERLEAVKSYADLTPLFEEIAAAIRDGRLKEAGLTGEDSPRRLFAYADLLHPHNAGFSPLAMPLVVHSHDLEARVVNWFATQEFRDLAALRQEWQMAGYAPESPLDPDEVAEGYRAGRYAALVGIPVWEGSAGELQAQFGFDWITKPVAPAFIPNQLPGFSLTAINASIASDAERVRRTMALLEWIHTDPQIYNLLVYGVEGEHWAWEDEKEHLIHPLPGGNRYRPVFAEQIGSRTLSYDVAPHRDLWKQVAQSSRTAPISPGIGFTFDPRPVQGEWSSVQGLLYEWSDALINGQADNVDKTIQRLLKTLDEAGLPAIEAEVIRQFAEWQRINDE